MMKEPRFARWLLERAAGPPDRNVVVGDFTEEFTAIQEAQGRRAALRWYRMQVLRSLVPLVRARLSSPRSQHNRRPLMPSLWADLKFTRRLAARAPLGTAAVLATMAVGVAATTAVVSVIGSVLLDPLPYPHPEQLVYVRHDGPDYPDWTSTSYPDVQDWRSRNLTFTGLVSFTDREVTLTGSGEPQMLRVLEMSEDAERVLALRPEIGRFFSRAEFSEGNNAVVVLSNQFWRRQFGGDPGVIGKTIVLSDVAHTIIGVRRFLPTDFPMEAELWRPLVVERGSWMSERGPNWLNTIGRIRPGVTLTAAQADLTSIASALAREFPATNARRPAVELIPLQELAVRGARPMLLLLLGAALLVLTTACTSIGGLLIARSQQRRREFLVRASLGASGPRLIAQMLTESVALALAGSVLGIALAPVLLDALVALYPGSIPRSGEIGIDARALLVAVAVALIAGVAFGLAPARHARTPRLADRLRSAERSSASPAQMQLRTAIVAIQMMLSVVLLAGGGLLVRSFVALTRVDPGFRTDGVLTFQVAVPRARYNSTDRIEQFYNALLARLNSLPGAQSAGSINYVPLGSGLWTNEIVVDGDTIIADVRIISPGYFETMGIGVRRGRGFTPSDRPGSPRVAIVNETLARKLAATGDALGRRIAFTDTTPEIVGVVADVHHYSLAEEPRAEVYVPTAHLPMPFRYIVLRTSGAPADYVSSARAAVQSLDSDLPITQVATMDERLSNAVAPQRFRALLIGCLAVAALVLAVLGLYGVIATLVTGRTRELGIRLALGESPGTVLRRVLGWALAPALIGATFGLFAAYSGARLLTTFVYGVSVHDPLVFTIAPSVLLLTAVMGALFPAIRASRTDPLSSLRDWG